MNDYFSDLQFCNISEIFAETYNEYRNKYKYTEHTSRIKYTAQDIYLMLHDFTYNSAYFSRFKGTINGSYLNEIHQFLIKHSFYDILYEKLLNIYLNITNYATLNDISADSAFIRNILGKDCNRNPFYNNKPGFKCHVIVDSNRVPISLVITNCTENDSLSIQSLFDNLFINKKYIKENTNVLIDSGYESSLNNYYLTQKGFNVYAGYNKRISVINNVKINVSVDDLLKYKTRGIVENTFGNLERYPILINNYEKNIKSYRGLLMFVMCVMLSKKINKIIREKNNIKIKQRRETNVALNREKIKIKKKDKKERWEIQQKENNIKKEKRKEERCALDNMIKNKIFTDASKSNALMKSSYDTYIMHKKLKYKNKCEYKLNKKEITRIINIYDTKILSDTLNGYNERKTKEFKSIDKYIENIKIEIYKDIINNYIYKISAYKFGKKTLKLLHVSTKAFSEENIKNITDRYEWQIKITEFTKKLASAEIS